MCILQRVINWARANYWVEVINCNELPKDEPSEITADGSITLSAENSNAFKKAVKIGIFKSLFKEKIIDATQLDRLIQMQSK
jgi:hypothetical protein